MAATVVLVHGAWHGAWCWQRVTPLLDAAGVPWTAVDLPTCDDAAPSATTLHDDARTLRDALDHLGGPAVVCGHSYGGMVITEGAAGHPSAKQLVYLTAFMPDEGDTMFSLTSSAPASAIAGALRPNGDGRIAVDTGAAADVFYHDCDADSANWAITRLRPMWMDAEAPGAIAWKSIPSIYVVASLDRCVQPALQRRMSQHAARVLEWDTGHSPFLSRPDLVADLLTALASRAG